MAWVPSVSLLLAASTSQEQGYKFKRYWDLFTRDNMSLQHRVGLPIMYSLYSLLKSLKFTTILSLRIINNLQKQPTSRRSGPKYLGSHGPLWLQLWMLCSILATHAPNKSGRWTTATNTDDRRAVTGRSKQQIALSANILVNEGHNIVFIISMALRWCW